jgi:anaerobic magnesium-protoporphyrin IX monomethyl ester cyclase
MRVLLTQPVSNFGLRNVVGMKSPPLGLAYVGAAAERVGCEVKVIDSASIGLSNRQLIDRIVEYEPDVLGVGTTTMGYTEGLSLVSSVKERKPRTFTVMGGPHVTFTDEETLRQCAGLDAVVRGEGEKTFEELLMAVQSRASLSAVEGLTYRVNGDITRNPDRPRIQDLDALGFAGYHLLPMETYHMGRGNLFACMITSRGCPYACSFCSSSNLFGKKWRFRSPEHVVAEMEYLKDRFGCREVEILDDTFTVSPQRADRICELLINKKWDLLWSASSRLGTLTLDMARKLKRAGCTTLYLGFESASQEVLDSLCKGVKLEEAFKTMEVVHKAGLRAIGSFILGCPADTVETIKKTIRFARALAPRYAQFTLLTPYPGTPLYGQALTSGLIADNDWTNYTIVDPILRHPSISARKLKRYVNWAYVSFYLRPRYVFDELRDGSFYLVPRAFKAFVEHLAGRV